MYRISLITFLLGPTLALFFDADFDQRWVKFKNEYGRRYDPVEELQRRFVYEKTMHFVQRHNQEVSQGIHSYIVGENQFSDMISGEFNAIVNGFNNSLRLGHDVCDPYLPPKDVYGHSLNSTVDWRPHGYVTEVKNQGRCRSCYAFATTGTLEGQQCKVTGKLVSLSEQNILDCSWKQGNKACEGGSLTAAYEYIIENHGIETELSYQQNKPVKHECHFKKENVGAVMSSCKTIARGSEKDLQIAVALEGPVSVAIDASQIGFQSYKSGVYDDASCTRNLNHAVLVVGYGTEHGKDYWLVKNSWGQKWGENGYAKILRNDNHCGIADNSMFTVV